MQIGLRRIGVFASFCILSSCSVNRALVDPWSYAPDDAYCLWVPDSLGSHLACEKEELPDLPCKNYPLSLAEVIDIALINNPATRISWSEARQAAASYAVTQSALLPSLTGTYYYANIREAFLSANSPGNITPDTGNPGSQNTLFLQTWRQWGPQTELTYNVLDFGQRRATTEAARYALYFANYSHNRQIQTLLENIAVDYYGLLYQIKLLEAYEANVATAQETFDAADLGLREGTQDVSDVLQGTSQLLQTEIQLVQQKQAIVNARGTLLNEMGLPANADIILEKLPSDFPDEIALAPLDDWIEMMKMNRPDLLAARASVHSAQETLTAANRAWLPNVNYTLDFGKTWFNGINDKYDYTSLISVSMPLFAGFSYRNNIRKAEAAERGAEATLRQVELAALLQVTSAYSNVSVSLDTLKASNKLLKAAEEQYKVAIAQYRAGVGTIVEVTNAQSTLFDARARVANAMQQWLTSLVTLSYSAGTLSKPPCYEKANTNQ